jgi:putative ABC transport system substrate-binding protein
MIATEYDPLALGYVKSLARPGGRVTGVFLQQIELASKRLQLLKDALPSFEAATIFWDSLSEYQWKATSSAAASFGLRLAKTAKAIGLQIPDKLLALADEVIE